MEDFAENACPTPQGIVGSMAILRKEPEPFGADALTSRLDLLLLAFLRGIPTIEQRASRLQEALKLVAGRLENDHEVAYRHVFLEPAHKKLDQRRIDALQELQELVPFRELKTPAAVARIEDRMLLAVADILLDPVFERELDEKHPMPARTAPHRSLGPTHAFQPLSWSLALEIDDEDYRKMTVHRQVQLQTLLPDQRVASLRYYTRGSSSLPVDGSVKMLSQGHTYLGTLPDRLYGAVADWMTHLVHLGSRKEPGDIVNIEMSEEYFDEAASDDQPFVTLTVDHTGVSSLRLAMRLPRVKRAEATAESRITQSPHSNGVIVQQAALATAKDGWVRAEFTDLQVGLQYGIFFPDLDLYN
jgi:hypothetical protein